MWRPKKYPSRLAVDISSIEKSTQMDPPIAGLITESTRSASNAKVVNAVGSL